MEVIDKQKQTCFLKRLAWRDRTLKPYGDIETSYHFTQNGI